MTEDLDAVAEDRLYERIASILDAARSRVARSVNTAMVNAYWSIGREIVEVDQAGGRRARYGEEVIARVSVRLRKRFGHGFGPRSLRRMRQFFTTYPAGSAIGLPTEIRSTVLTESQGPTRALHRRGRAGEVSIGADAPRIGGSAPKPSERTRPHTRPVRDPVVRGRELLHPEDAR